MSEFRAEKGSLQDHTWRWVAPALKSPKLPEGFWQNTFKSQVGRWGEWGAVTGSVIVHSSLIGWWRGSRVVSQELTLSVLRLQRLRAMCLRSSSSYLPFVGIDFLHLQNNSGPVHQVLLSRYFREEQRYRIREKACPHPKVPWVLPCYRFQTDKR